jgi:hypothetical protein
MNGYSFLALKAWIEALYTVSDPASRLYITPYGFTTTFLALAQNATQTNQVPITANADFVLTGIKHRAQIGAAQTISTKTAPFVRLLITDSGSNEQYTAQAVDLENYSANGFGERPLPYPRWIAGRTSLTLQATNYAPTAETYTSLDVFLEGVLVRKFSAPGVA